MVILEIHPSYLVTLPDRYCQPHRPPHRRLSSLDAMEPDYNAGHVVLHIVDRRLLMSTELMPVTSSSTLMTLFS